MKKLSPKGQQTRKSILMAAHDLIHARGLHGTSIDDVLQASGTGKSQFYHYFDSKEDLIHQLLLEVKSMFEEGVFNITTINSWDEFDIWLDNIIDCSRDYAHSRACPIGQLCAQLPDADDADVLQQDIRDIFDFFISIPFNFFTQEKEAGTLIDSANPKDMAEFCVSALQGGALTTKVYQEEQKYINIINHLKHYAHSFRQK